MTTEEGFLRTILDDINDATRRLVFADWLDEHCDPRGEWLRLDCELAKLGLTDRRRRALEGRKRKVWEAHRESLLAWERRFALARIQVKVVRAPRWLDKGAKHKGRRNPVLSEKKLATFERQHRVTLPEEYRTFLREVGNGGLGPGDGLCPLAEAVERSPSRDLDKPFPFTFRVYEEEGARFRELEYAQPGVLYLATPHDPWASVYLVITGEDRGLMWAYGHIGECGWIPEAPTSEEDEKQIDKPPRSFFSWYEDWLDEILANENAGGSE